MVTRKLTEQLGKKIRTTNLNFQTYLTIYENGIKISSKKNGCVYLNLDEADIFSNRVQFYIKNLRKSKQIIYAMEKEIGDGKKKDIVKFINIDYLNILGSLNK